MFKLSKLAMVLSLTLLTGAVIFAAAEARPDKPAVKQSDRLVRSIRRELDASGKPVWEEAIKLNRTKLVLPGQAQAISVKLTQRRYWCELTNARGEPIEKQYATVSTLRSISSISPYAFSFCTPNVQLEVPHSFRLFSYGAGKNYLVWTASQFIFLVEVSKSNDRTETFMRRLCFHDPGRFARQKAIIKQMSGKKVDLHDYLWRTQASQLVARDFGLTSMPEIVNVPALIAKDEYGISKNSLYDELFVVSMSAPKKDSMSLQFVGPKMNTIYTVSKKDGKWRLTGKEPLTAKKAQELAPLLRG